VGWTMRFPSGIASCTSSYGANCQDLCVCRVKGIAEPEPAFCYQGISLKADIHGETPVEETNPAQGRSAICKQKPIIWPTAFSPQNSLRPAEKKAAAISSILANLYQAWRAYVVEPKNSLSRLSTGVATFT